MKTTTVKSFKELGEISKDMRFTTTLFERTEVPNAQEYFGMGDHDDRYTMFGDRYMPRKSEFTAKVLLVTGENYVSLRTKTATYLRPRNNGGTPLLKISWKSETLKITKGKLTFWIVIDGKPMDCTFRFVDKMQNADFTEPGFAQAIADTFGSLDEISARIVRERRPTWEGVFPNHAHQWMKDIGPKDTPKGFLKKRFGRNFNKRVMRTLAPLATQMGPWEWYGLLDGCEKWSTIFPIEWIMDWIDENQQRDLDDGANYFAPRIMVPHYPYMLEAEGGDRAQRLRELLIGSYGNLRKLYEHADAIMLACDTLLMHDALDEEGKARFQIERNMNRWDWGLLHDQVNRYLHEQCNREYYEQMANQKRFVSEAQAEFQGAVIDSPQGEITIRVPETGLEMIKWAKEMHNCIDTYASDETALYLGLYRDEKLFANVQIHDHQLRQLLGKYNKNLDMEDFEVITNWMIKNDLVRPESLQKCWGYPA